MEKIIEKARLYEVAEVQLTYKNKVKPALRPQLTNGADAAKLLRSVWDEDRIEYHEQFKVVFLNTALRVLGIINLNDGGMADCSVDIRMLFAAALKAAATGIMLAHNHPSGNLTPSGPDIRMTEKIREAAKLLDIKLLDHVILSADGYLSMAEEGHL
jgi:DNA repair protein RadC